MRRSTTMRPSCSSTPRRVIACHCGPNPTPERPIPTERLLVIHPAISLAPETTYAVALRDLHTTAGEPIAVSPVFAAYRDRLTTEIDAIESRRDAMEETIEALEAAGVDRDDLQLAWSFTTASTENTTAPILKMRDETMAGLGDSTPEFEITSVTDDPEADGLARFVEGLYSVPNYLTGDGSPGSALNIGADGLPQQNPDTPTVLAPFACGISEATMAGTEPAHLVQYGHGLLGSNLEVDAGNIVAMSNEHNTVYCATKWAGFSEDDIPTAVAALGDMSLFPTFVDRMTQGLPEPARARPADARRQRSDQPPRFRPARRHTADRQQRAVLRRQQSGRHHGLGARRHLAGLRAGRARRGRHELLDPAATVRRLRHVRGDLRPRLPQRARPDAAAVGHPDGVGPHGGVGLRPPRRRRSTARHAREDGADARRVRRLAGQRADGDDRGAHDGCADPPPRHRRRPQRRGRARLGHRHARLPVRRIGARDLGFRLRPHPDRADRSEYQSRSAQRPAQRRRRPDAEGELPLRRTN